MPEPTPETPGQVEGPARDGATGSAPARQAVPSPMVAGDGAVPKAKSGADWRDAVKAAKSKQAAEQRNRRGKYTSRRAAGAQRGPAGPGMVRRVPPSDGGAS